MGKEMRTPTAMSPEAVKALGMRYAPGWLRRKVLVRDRYKCYRCGQTVTDKTANIDHVIPWPWGMTEEANLRAICRPCNQEKGRRHPKPSQHYQDSYTGQWFGKKSSAMLRERKEASHE